MRSTESGMVSPTPRPRMPRITMMSGRLSRNVGMVPPIINKMRPMIRSVFLRMVWESLPYNSAVIMDMKPGNVATNMTMVGL